MDVKEVESWNLRYDRTQSMHRTDDGIELYYEHYGHGPWLVILTGGFVVSTVWKNFTQRLVETNTILTFDARNQGASSLGDGAYENHLRDLKSLLDELEVDQAYILGVSFSTLFSRDFAVEHPERVKGLIQCTPAMSPYGSKRRDYILKAWLAALEAGGPPALFDAVYPFAFSDKTIARGGSATYLALRERFLAVNSHAQLRTNLEGGLQADDDVDKLRRLQCPVLLVTGDNDFNASRSSLEDQKALIPDARIEIIEGAGHSPYAEASDAFEEIIAKFIAEVERNEARAASSLPQE